MAFFENVGCMATVAALVVGCTAEPEGSETSGLMTTTATTDDTTDPPATTIPLPTVTETEGSIRVYRAREALLEGTEQALRYAQELIREDEKRRSGA